MTSSPPVFPDSFISISVPEFTVGEIFDFNATDDVDSEGDGLSYVIRSRDRSVLNELQIDGATGVLTLISPASRNSLLFDVVAFDSDNNKATSTVVLDLSDVEQPPVLGSDNSFNADEGSTGVVGFVSAFDPDDFSAPITFSLSGPDADLFQLVPNGFGNFADIIALSPLSALPPNDADGDTVFEIIVTADDGTSTASGLTEIYLNGFVPPILNGDYRETSENVLYEFSLTGFDLDGDTLTYSIVGGPDASLFELADLAGDRVRFRAPPDFESPSDADSDNIYELIAEVSDGTFSDQARIFVEVLDDPADDIGSLIPTVFDFSDAVGPRAISFSSALIDTIDTYRAAQSEVSVDAAGVTIRANTFSQEEGGPAKISFLGDGLSIRRTSETWQDRRVANFDENILVDLTNTENFGKAQNLTLLFDEVPEDIGLLIEYKLDSRFPGGEFVEIPAGTTEVQLSSSQVFDGFIISHSSNGAYRLSGMAMDREDLSGSGGGGSSGGSTLITLDFTNQEATGRAVTTLVDGGIVDQQVYTGYPTSLSVDAAGIDISANNTVAPDAKVSFLGNGLSVRSDQDNDFVVKGERKTVEANEELIFKFNDSPTLGDATELSLAFDYVAGNGNFLVDFYLDGEATISRTFLSSAIKVTGVDFDEVRLSTDGDLAFRLAEIEFLREDLIA